MALLLMMPNDEGSRYLNHKPAIAYTLEMDRVYALGERREHQPISIGHVRRERTAGEETVDGNGTLKTGDRAR